VTLKRFLIILFILPVTCFAQVNKDSLTIVWNTSDNDSNRFEALALLAESMRQVNIDSSFKLAEMGAMKAYELGYPQFESNFYNLMGIARKHQKNYLKAIEYYRKTIELRTQQGDSMGVAGVNHNLANVYRGIFQYKLALDHYAKALKINEALGNNRWIINNYTGIGICYKVQGEYESALEFYKKAEDMCLEIDYQRGLIFAYKNMANIFKIRMEYEEALKFNLKSLAICEQLNLKSSLINALIGTGTVREKLNRNKEAKEDYQRALEIAEELGNKSRIVGILSSLGLLNAKNGQPKVGLLQCGKALKIADEENYFREMRQCHACLSRANEELGTNDKALFHYKQYVAINDSIVKMESKDGVIKNNEQFKYERKRLQDSVAFANKEAIHDQQILEKEAESAQKDLVTEKYKSTLYAAIGGVLLLLIIVGFSIRSYSLKKRDNATILQQKEIVENSNLQLELKNKEILDSISYAKRIQSAILPSSNSVRQNLGDSFIMYKPKDIVAGDFYWLEKFNTKDNKNGVLFAAADCTGHGVPGAMVSVVCNNALNRSVREQGLTDPGEILDMTREIVVKEFELDGSEEYEVMDGMDIALCSLIGSKLKYAGANNPLWIIRNGDFIETKADKQPIGKYLNHQPFTSHEIELQKGDTIYIFSDGYVDQFGGDKGKKLKPANFRKLLLSIQDLSMEEQKNHLTSAFIKWQGELEQVDDVCVIGLRV